MGGTVGSEPAGINEVAHIVQHRHASLCGQLYQTMPHAIEQGVGRHPDRLDPALRHHGERTVQLVPCPCLDNTHLNAKRPSGRFRRRYQQRRQGTVRIHQQGEPGGAWDQLPKQFKTFTVDFRPGGRCQPSDVAARPREAFDKPAGDGVGRQDHDNRDRGGGALDGLDLLTRDRHDHLGSELDELEGEFWEPLELSVCVPEFEDEVLSFDIPQVTQPGTKGFF